MWIGIKMVEADAIYKEEFVLIQNEQLTPAAGG
jgi:hypothetical protein